VKYDSEVLTLSGETGYAFKIRQDSDWVVEPQAQILYVHSDVDGLLDPVGAQIGGHQGSGWISRLGVRVHRTWIDDAGRRTQPYMTLNWWHDNVDDTVAFDTVKLRDLYPSNRYEVKLGVNAERGNGWSFWANVGYQWGSQTYRAITGRIGAKRTW
jgi:outer membrane autotransporter protein